MDSISKHKLSVSDEIRNTKYPKDYFVRSDLGLQPKPGIHNVSKLTNDNEVIYDVTYTIGADGFRVTPFYSAQTTQKVNFFGCSFLFGEGLNDDQTLPYFFARLNASLVKNYGSHGWSPSQALAILESSRDTTGEVNILLTAPWHASRLPCMPFFSAGLPKYVLRNGIVERDGYCPFSPIRPNTNFLAQTLSQSRFVNFVENKINILLQNRHQDDQIKLYIGIIREIDKISKSRGQRFTVGFIRANKKWFTGSYSNDSVIKEFIDDNIEVIDLTLARSAEALDRKYYLNELDKHPSALANIDRASLLVDALRH